MTTTTEHTIVNPLIAQIPGTLDRQAVLTALEPLYELLGITSHDYYADPGLVITGGEISFSIPANYPPAQLGTHGRRLLEAETRITVPLTPEEVDGLTFQRVADSIRALTSVPPGADS